MATAIVGGLIDGELMTPERIVGADKDTARRQALAERRGVGEADSNCEAIAEADIVLLAVKPQNAAEVLSEIGPELRAEQLVISILAGTEIATIEAACEADVPTVRVMPNTPALIGCGAAALAPGSHAGDEHLDLARAVFESVGVCVDLDEEALDAVTGLSGSGPGYIFLFVEALIQAGMDVGLSARVSHRLVVQTLVGSARLLCEDPQRRSAGELREAVTSPGGTTEAGLSVLKKEGVPEAIRMAIHAATKRSRELGQG
jgi:pyrroline-5-carboxylate reductase